MKKLKAINEPLTKRLNIVEKDLYELELLKSTIEHREPIIVGFFILQYEKLRMLELYYNFFDKFFDVNRYEVLDMDTYSIYLAPAEENLKDCIQPEKEVFGKNENDYRDSFKADAKSIFFLERVAVSIKSKISRSRDFSKKILGAQKCYVYVAKHIAALTKGQISSNLAAKD